MDANSVKSIKQIEGRKGKDGYLLLELSDETESEKWFQAAKMKMLKINDILPNVPMIYDKEQPANVDDVVNTPVVVDSNDDGTVAQELELEQMRSTLDEAILETRSMPLKSTATSPHSPQQAESGYREGSEPNDGDLFGSQPGPLRDGFNSLWPALAKKVVLSQPGEQELKNVSQRLGPSSAD
ncbi:unnamed protein product [Parnassius apollo]|uniref:(apollo) hypothetical protein n=1 Tax=Parnassius apollo TaxID=110799 RepID=A0A8S3XJA1_PARAO|nr:unnamed protein product [Parnassius apollo]